MTPVLKYRGHELTWSDSMNQWKVEIAEHTYYNIDPKKLKEKVNAFEKGKVNGIVGLMAAGYNSKAPYEKVKVTSITEDGQVWITRTRSGRRERVYKASHILTTSEHNKVLIVQIIRIKNKVNALREKLSDLEDKLERLDLSHYGVNIDR